MRNKGWLWLLLPPALALFGFGFGELVMHLWNWLLPPLFGWHTITFWQGLGLLLLCRILVGGIGGGGDRKGGKCQGGRGWGPMSPEERERMRERMGGRCGVPPQAGDGAGNPA